MPTGQLALLCGLPSVTVVVNRRPTNGEQGEICPRFFIRRVAGYFPLGGVKSRDTGVGSAAFIEGASQAITENYHRIAHLRAAAAQNLHVRFFLRSKVQKAVTSDEQEDALKQEDTLNASLFFSLVTDLKEATSYD